MAEKLTKEDVIRIVEEKQLKFIRFWFTDVLGSLKSFAITPAELEGASRRAWALTAHRSRGSPASRNPT